MKKKVTSEKRTTALTVLLTEKEAETVRKWAKYTRSKSVSAFIRKCLYMVGCLQINIRLDNNDVRQLSEALNNFCLCLTTYAGELLKRDDIEVEDIDLIYKKMDEVYDAAVKCRTLIFTERHMQRRKAERYIIDWADNLLGLTKERT